MIAGKRSGILCIAVRLLPAERSETGGSEGDRDGKLGRRSSTMWEGISRVGAKNGAGDQQRIRTSNSSTLSFVDARRFFFCMNATKHVHSRRIVIIRAGNESDEETKLKKWVGITWRWMLSTYTFLLCCQHILYVYKLSTFRYATHCNQ